MKIALIEIGGSHDECLYSQVKILKSVKNVHLTLICDESLRENVKYYDSVDENIFIQITKKGFRQWRDLYELWKLCKKEKFDKIIFNTAQGKIISKFLMFPFSKRVDFYGTLHNVSKLGSSGTQRRISKKVKHYFILNEYLENGLMKNNTKNNSFSVFHPVFFPNYPKLKIDKKENEIWICIPGQVELKRRDYGALFESIKAYGININIKFLLLGKYGHKHGDGDFIKKHIQKLSIENQFMTWEGFIPVSTFNSMIKMSDYILPLIHNKDSSGELYQNQISGAFNIAVGHKKEIIVETALSEILRDYSPVVYEKQSLMKTINNLTSIDVDDLFTDEKWSFDYQKKSFLKALNITY